ncbi:MAG: class I SAM-dependent methyltransferase [Nanoarchaeota archaeon]
MEDLKLMYRRRFNGDEKFRKEMYAVICKDFLQKFVAKNSVVLDVAAGHCEFINAIEAKQKIALDLNPDVRLYASKDVKCIVSSSSVMNGIKTNSVDVVYCSNFFEHISKAEITKTIKRMHKVLKKNGQVLIIQPNIRYCYKDYWMFFDHITPLDDRSTSEALELNGFSIIKVIPQFLPYTTKSILPKSALLVSIYLKIPLLWKIFGGQAFIIAKKV